VLSAHKHYRYFTTDTCEPVLNSTYKCTVVIGRMRLFLSSNDAVEEVAAFVLDNIQIAFNDTDFVDKVGSGLLRISFIGSGGVSPETAIKDAAEDSDASKSTNIGQEGDSALGLPLSSMLFVTVGSAAIVMFVGSIYLWRRRRTDELDGAASRLNGSFLNATDDNSRRPASPYSEMVSGSYRLDRLGEMSILSSSNMSPVYEQDQEDNDTAGGSVVLSEGGYTTDAGYTDGGDSTSGEAGSKHSSSQSTPKVLGARPFPMSVNMNMEEVSDSDLDTSGEMSPVKLYIGNQLLLPTGSEQEEEESNYADESLLFSPRAENGISDIESVDQGYEMKAPST
jgi:hypothetical protein